MLSSCFGKGSAPCKLCVVSSSMTEWTASAATIIGCLGRSRVFHLYTSIFDGLLEDNHRLETDLDIYILISSKSTSYPSPGY